MAKWLTERRTARSFLSLFAAFIMLVLTTPASAGADDSVVTVAPSRAFAQAGPYEVASTARMHPCQESLYGMIETIAARVFGNFDDPTCSHAFPNGLDSPVGVQFYYPENIADLTAAPLVVFMGGITSEPGNYQSLVTQWASLGFVVAVSYDYVNSLPEVSTMGLAAALQANRDSGSPLHGKIDLSRTVFAGHSAGGGAALQAGALFPPVAKSIDPDFNIVGVLAIEPGPVALGSAVTVPTLYLTGVNDIVVPDFGWVRWWQYNIHSNAPAWIANARGDGHFAPIDGIDHYLGSGAASAWLQYVALDNHAAAQLFTGEQWLLPTDKTFYSAERNARAAAIN